MTTQRSLVVYELMSLDGVGESPDEFLRDWDDVMDHHLAGVIGSQDTVLLGRKSYDEWSRFWPESEIQPFADFINNVTKYVATSTDLTAGWNNSHRIDGDLCDFVRSLKSTNGGEIGVHASLSVAATLLSAGLVDQLRVLIAPAIAGSGKRFVQADHRVELRLDDVVRTPSGALLVSYSLS